MKAIFTLIFILFFGLTAFAQNTETNDTLEPIKMDVVLDSGVITINNTKEIKIGSEKSVARLYKFKNSRVKKALAFTTKKDRPKLT
ncbi:hypothetical protein [Maribacter sp. HTCC2170]|uniref:hypothetical protein n=1 Tax=Maribacter sp. (strain HTCC2170 / KCCM 42371) TaxID=313603 RepID=UPI00006B21A0|nr:hypothetical protein [Maribacter sp. HTCC2170]EAR00126.1 hypothetical protein FB2170_00630 [Maribacter sp. HTCC2170]